MVPPASDRVPPAPPYSGFGLGSVSVSRTGLSPAPARLSRHVPLPRHSPSRPPYNPARASTPAVWAGPLSLAATRGVTVVFLSSAYLDVSVRRVGHLIRLARLQRAGFPHSDIRGSKAVRASPRLFAACRVLLRLREPRHPPCALWYLSRTITPVPPPLGSGPFEYPRSLELVFSFLPSCQRTFPQPLGWGRSSPGQTRTADPHIISVVL